MNRNKANSPFFWIFWHPHQRLWNWKLVKLIRKVSFIKPLGSLLIFLLVLVDTFLLAISLQFKPRNVNIRGYHSQKRINFFELGTHKDALELRWVAENILSKLDNPYTIYAFEANPDSYAIAVKNTAHLNNVRFYNFALVKDLPESRRINLYTEGEGFGDSVYKKGGNSSLKVPARRLSEIICDENVNLAQSINLLRMNIEGSEMDVIEDLVEAKMIQHFDGFYGMWDDISKLDYERDLKFRKLIKENGIFPFPFNGRDMHFCLRRRLIRKSLGYSIKGRFRLTVPH